MNKVIVGRGRSKATQRIEITDPLVSREHCILTDNGDGTYTLENKSKNGTFVDGRRVIKTVVDRDTVITLSEHTKVRVSDLLPIGSPSPSSSKETVPGFSVRGLESVWRNYHDEKMALQRKQHSIGMLVRIPMICSAVTGVLIGVLPQEFRFFTILLTLIGICVMVYGFIKQKNFVLAVELDKLDRWLQDNYVCPNPACRCYLGNIPYIVLQQTPNCKYCKCKLHE